MGNPKTEEWVYAGRRTNSKEKIAHQWFKAGTEEGADYREGRNFVRSAAIGSVYKITESKPGSFFTSGPDAPKYLRRLTGPQVLLWTALDEAAVQYDANIRLAKMEGKESEIEKALEPLLQIMDKLDSRARSAMANKLLEKIYTRKIFPRKGVT